MELKPEGVDVTGTITLALHRLDRIAEALEIIAQTLAGGRKSLDKGKVFTVIDRNRLVDFAIATETGELARAKKLCDDYRTKAAIVTPDKGN